MSTPTDTPKTLPNGRHDHAKRRRGIRWGRRKGVGIYIAAEDLIKAGYDPEDPAPSYRVWAGPRGRLVIQLYKEQ